jgi:hypothetical protein
MLFSVGEMRATAILDYESLDYYMRIRAGWWPKQRLADRCDVACRVVGDTVQCQMTSGVSSGIDSSSCLFRVFYLCGDVFRQLSGAPPV